ncbi:MAG: helix-turn-helix domain-containing protein [Shimia sp.]
MADTTDEDETSNVVTLKPKQAPPEDKRVLNQKWGKATMDANYTVIPSALLRGQARLGIDAMELAVLMHLLDHWWQADKMPWPSKKTIAERLRVSEKTIQRAMVRLEEGKLIQRNPRYHKTGGRTSNEYDLSPLVERLKPIAEDLVQAKKDAEKIKKQAERPGLKNRAKKKVAS